MKFKIFYSINGQIEPFLIVEDQKEFLALFSLEVEDINFQIDDEGTVSIRSTSQNNKPLSPLQLKTALSALAIRKLISKDQYSEFLEIYTQHYRYPTIGYKTALYTDLTKMIADIKEPSELTQLGEDLHKEIGFLSTFVDSRKNLEFYVSAVNYWSTYFAQALQTIKKQQRLLKIDLLETTFQKSSDYLNHKDLSLSRLIASEIYQYDEKSNSLDFFISTLDAYLEKDADFRYVCAILVFALLFNDHLKINHTKVKIFEYDDPNLRLLMADANGSYISERAFIIYPKLTNNKSLATFIHEVMHFIIDIIFKNQTLPYNSDASEEIKQKWNLFAKTLHDENIDDKTSLFNLSGYSDRGFVEELAVRIFEFKFLNQKEKKISRKNEINEFCNHFYTELIKLCKMHVLSYCEILGLTIKPYYQNIFDLFAGEIVHIKEEATLLECIKSEKSFLTFYIDKLAKNEVNEFIINILNDKNLNIDALCQLLYYEGRPNLLAKLVTNLPQGFTIDNIYLHNTIYNFQIPLINYLCMKCKKLSLLEQILSKFPKSLEIISFDGNLPLHSVLTRKLNFIELVLCRSAENNIDLSIQGYKSDTILHMAVKLNNTALVEYILTLKNFDFHQKNEKEENALHIACKNGYCEIAKILINQDVSFLDAIDRDGNTPLHLACENSRIEIVELLLNHSQELTNRKNYTGHLPEDLCQEEFKQQYLALKNSKTIPVASSLLPSLSFFSGKNQSLNDDDHQLPDQNIDFNR